MALKSEWALSVLDLLGYLSSQMFDFQDAL